MARGMMRRGKPATGDRQVWRKRRDENRRGVDKSRLHFPHNEEREAGSPPIVVPIRSEASCAFFYYPRRNETASRTLAAPRESDRRELRERGVGDRQLGYPLVDRTRSLDARVIVR